MNRVLEYLGRQSRRTLLINAYVIVAMIGLADYVTGPELSLSIFYLLAICLGCWFAGPKAAVLLAVTSALTWLAADVGTKNATAFSFVPVWNAAVRLGFFLIIIRLMTALRSLTDLLERRVQDRTSALREEIAERKRLEREILEVRDREQQRLGQELHDELCQYLVAVELAAKLLEEKLIYKSLPEVTDGKKVVGMINHATIKARNLARGLYSVELDAEGLVEALRQLGRDVETLFKVQCQLRLDHQLELSDKTQAAHLYRIAHEAVHNAVKHARPTWVRVELHRTDGTITLAVKNNGRSMTDATASGHGLGMQLMATRARLLGGELDVHPYNGEGTAVICSFKPKRSANRTDSESEQRP